MDAARIRVATYNVHGCVGADGRRDPDRVARVIHELDADVVALQEFNYPADVALESRRPAILAAFDQYECALGPTRQAGAQAFGNIVLTRHPIVDVTRIDLSIERREPRGAVGITINVRGVVWHVLAAHLGLRVPERRFQVRQIVNYLESVRGTFLVVLGDFNDWLPGRSVVHMLDQRLGRPTRPRSFPARWPFLRLDRVWVDPARAVHHIRTHQSPAARQASDHLPVVADIDATGVAVGRPAPPR